MPSASPAPTSAPEPSADPTPSPSSGDESTLPSPAPSAGPSGPPYGPTSTPTPPTAGGPIAVVPDRTPTPGGQGGSVDSATGHPGPIDTGSGTDPAQRVLDAVQNGAGRVAAAVRPAAAVAVATTFTFPLALMVAVLAFLALQGRVDGGDPKLRYAPRNRSETLLPFADEVDL